MVLKNYVITFLTASVKWLVTFIQNISHCKLHNLTSKAILLRVYINKFHFNTVSNLLNILSVQEETVQINYLLKVCVDFPNKQYFFIVHTCLLLLYYYCCLLSLLPNRACQDYWCSPSSDVSFQM